jgi:hypothetical protein
MCHWLKCEHDYVIARVWMSCADICQLRRNILSLNWFPMKTITQKFNIFLTIGLKFMKSPSRNLTHQRLSHNTKSLHQFLLINLYMILLNFQWQKCSIFHNCCTTILPIIKPPWWTLLHWGLKPSVPRVAIVGGGGHHDFGDLNVTNK